MSGSRKPDQQAANVTALGSRPQTAPRPAAFMPGHFVGGSQG